jgi:hypothetical protein
MLATHVQAFFSFQSFFPQAFDNMSGLVKSIPRNSRPGAEQSGHFGNQLYDEETIPKKSYNEALMREHHLAKQISQMRHSLYADEVGVRRSYTCSDSDESCSTAAELSRFEDCDDQENVPDVDEEDITNYIRRHFQADYDMDESESDSSDIRRYASRSDDVEESDSDEDIRYASRSDFLMNPENSDSDSSSHPSSCVEERFLSQSAPDMSESDDDAYAPIRGVGRPTISSASSFIHCREQSKFDTQSLQASRHRGRGRPALTRAASCRAGSGSRSQPGQYPTDSSSGTYSMKEAPLLGHGGRPTLERANSCEGEFSYWHKSSDVDRDEMHSLYAHSYHAESSGRVPMRSGASLGSRRPKPDDGRWLAKQISQRSLSGLRTSSHHDPPAMDSDEMESSSSGESFGDGLESGFEGYGGEESVADAREEPSVAQPDDQAEFVTRRVSGLRTSSHHDPPTMNADELVESSPTEESFGGDFESGFEGYGESVAVAREEFSVAQSDDNQGEFETHEVATLRTSSHHDPPAMSAEEMESSSSGEPFGGTFESGFECYGDSVADAHEETSVDPSDDDQQGEFETHGVAAAGGSGPSFVEQYEDEESLSHGERGSSGFFLTDLKEGTTSSSSESGNSHTDSDDWELENRLLSDNEEDCDSSLSSSRCDSNLQHVQSQQEKSNKRSLFSKSNSVPSLRGSKPALHYSHSLHDRGIVPPRRAPSFGKKRNKDERPEFTRAASAEQLIRPDADATFVVATMRGGNFYHGRDDSVRSEARSCASSKNDSGIAPPRRAPSFGKKRNKDERPKFTRAASAEQLIRPDADAAFVVATMRGGNFYHGRDDSARSEARSCASSKIDSGIAPPRRTPSFGKKRNKDERPEVTRAASAEQRIRPDADQDLVVPMRVSHFFHGRDDSAQDEARACASSRKERGIMPPRRAPSFGKKSNKDKRPKFTRAASAEQLMRSDADQVLAVPMRVSSFYRGRDDSARSEARSCASSTKNSRIAPPRRVPSSEEKTKKDERPKVNRAASAEHLIQPAAGQTQEIVVPVGGKYSCDGRYASSGVEESSPSCPTTGSSTDGDVWLARYISRRSLTDMCRNSNQCEPPAMDPDEIDYSSSESSSECDMIFEFEQEEAKKKFTVDIPAQESGEKSAAESLALQIQLRKDSEQEAAPRHQIEPEQSKPPPCGKDHNEDVGRTADKETTDELSQRKDLESSDDATLETLQSKSLANYMISEEETVESSTKSTTKDVSATADGVDPHKKAEMVSTVSQLASEGDKDKNSGRNFEESMINSLVPEEASPEIGRDTQVRLLPIDDQSYSRQHQNIPQYLTCDTNSQFSEPTIATFSERSRTIPFTTPDGQQMTLLFSAINYTASVVPSVAMSTIGTSSSGQDYGSSAHSYKSKETKMRISSAHSKKSSETKKSKSSSSRSKKSKEMGQPKKAWKDLISSAYAHEYKETRTSSKRDKKQSLKKETKESECMYDEDLGDLASADLTTFLKASGDNLSESSKIAESAKTKSSKHLKKKEKHHKKERKDDKDERTQKKEKKKEKHHHKEPKEEKKEHKHQKEEKKEKSEKKENKLHKKDKEERKKDKKSMHKDDEPVKTSKSKKKDTKKKEKEKLSKAPSSEGTKRSTFK